MTATPSIWRLPLCLIRMCGGMPVTAWDAEGNLWCAWQCATCGTIRHAEKTGTRSAALSPDGGENG